MKRFLIWTIILLIFLIIVNKISKQFLNQTKYEKDTRINNIQKIYGNNYEDYVKIDKRFYRPAEKVKLLGDASKAKKELGWEATTNLEELAKIMVNYDLKNLKS